MSNIQKTLDSLQPYVIGIRYVEGMVLVDVVFKEGWSILEDENIKKIKGNDDINYYMLFSEVNGVGLDELLIYVEKTIKMNLDREKKHDLLRTKVNELKEIFKKNSLTKLMRLKFSFNEEDLVPSLTEFNIDEKLIDTTNDILPKTIAEEPEIEDVIESPIQPVQYLDENKQPIVLTDEDKEILEEEARAERNRKLISVKKNKETTPVTHSAKKIELPPRPKISSNMNIDCDCGPNEACEKCFDSKDL